MFYPLPEPMSVTEGDELWVALAANRIADRYIWSWNVGTPTGSSGATSLDGYPLDSIASIAKVTDAAEQKPAKARLRPLKRLL